MQNDAKNKLVMPSVRFPRSRQPKACTAAWLAKYKIIYKDEDVHYAMRCVICTLKLKKFKYRSPEIPDDFDYELFEEGKKEKGAKLYPKSNHWRVLLKACWSKKDKFPL